MSYDIPANVLALPITEADMRQTPKSIIVNVVVMFNLGNPYIDAETVTIHCPGFGFNPQSFAAVKIRMTRSMALVFSSSRAVCPGGRRISDSRLGALRITSLLLEANIPAWYNKFTVQNLVANCWAPFEIELADIHEEYSISTEYKTDKFPGLAFRMNQPSIIFNIFVTGRVIITGSKDYDHTCKCWWWLYTHVLVRHRRGTAARSTSSAAYKVGALRSPTPPGSRAYGPWIYRLL